MGSGCADTSTVTLVAKGSKPQARKQDNWEKQDEHGWALNSFDSAAWQTPPLRFENLKDLPSFLQLKWKFQLTDSGGQCSMFELTAHCAATDLRRIEQGTWDWSPLHVQQHALWRPWPQLISSRRAWVVGQLRDGWVGCKRKARLELEVERHVNDCLVTFLYFLFFRCWAVFWEIDVTCKTRSKRDEGLQKRDRSWDAWWMMLSWNILQILKMRCILVEGVQKLKNEMKK